MKNLGVLISERVFQLSLAFWVCREFKLFVNDLTGLFYPRTFYLQRSEYCSQVSKDSTIASTSLILCLGMSHSPGEKKVTGCH